MAKTKDGFYKLMGQIVGNNDYILLGGGGTKKISDFALSSDLNNYIQIGTSGVNKGYLRNVKVNNNNYSFLSNVNTDGFKIYAHSELGDNQLSFSNSNGLNYTSLKYLKFDIPDNGGRDSYLLIADVSGYSVNGEEKIPVVDAALIGTIYGYRAGNQSRTVVYNIVSCVSVYNTTGQSLTLYTDLYNNRVIAPYIVSYDNKKYIALRKRGSGFPVYFIGVTRGLLNEYITLNVNTGETLPEGMLILVNPNTGSNTPSITSTSIYQNDVTNTILHSGNYQNYLGYIGTTAVLKNSGSLDLTGIKHITSATTNTYSIGSSNNIWNKVYAHEVDVISGVFARNNNEYKSLIELSGNIVKVGDGFKSSDGILDLVGSTVRFWGGNNCAINLLNISGESGLNIDRMNSIGGNKIKLTVTGGKVMADGYYMYPDHEKNGYMIMTNGTSMHINNLLTAFSGGNISSSGNVISLSQKSITVGGTTKTIAASSANIINSLTLSSSSNSTTNLSLTVNVNGVSKNTTVTNLYAYHSKIADELKSHDTRNVDNTPSTFGAGARFEFKANNTDGLKDGGSYHGILHFRPYGSNSDFSGGRPHQLAFTENQNIWYRKAKSDTEWNAWKQLAFKSDITNYYWANVKISDTSSTTTTPTFGTTCVSKLKIINTDSAEHIEFSRASSNYISMPVDGQLVILPNGIQGGSSLGMLFSKDGLHPGTSNAYSLGTGDKQWNQLFVAEGNFNGNVNIAVDHGIYQYSDGIAKEALFLGSNRFELGKGLKNVTTWLNGLDFKFNTSSVDQAVIITSNGKVGIGNVGGAPAEKLHIGEGNVLADAFKAWSGGFLKNGSDDTYVLLGGGGHELISNLSVAKAKEINVKSSNTNNIFPLVFTNRNTGERYETLYTDSVLGSGYNPSTDSIYAQGYYIQASGASIPSYRVIRDHGTGAVWIQGGVYDGSSNNGNLHISGISATNLSALTIHGKILPSTTHAFDLGSSSQRWLNTYSLKFITTNGAVGSNYGYNAFDKDGNITNLLGLNTLNELHLGYGLSGKEGVTHIHGKSIRFRYGDGRTLGAILTNAGYFGIGLEFPAYRLDVNGTGLFSTQVITPKVNYAGILTINGTSGVYIKYNDTDSNSVVLGNKYFKPFTSSNGLLDLGLSNARWKTIYGQSGNLSSTLFVGGETTLKSNLKIQNAANSYISFYNNVPTTPHLTGRIFSISNYNTTTSYYNNGTSFYFRLYSPASGDTATTISTTGYTDYTLGPCARGLSNKSEMYKIWHSGNDGHESGLDADTVDGKHLSDIFADIFSDSGVWCGSANTDPTALRTESISTADLLGKLHTATNLFNYNFSAMRGGWYFNGNTDYDTGWGKFSMAGTAVLNLSVKKDTTDNLKTLLFIDSLGDMYSYVSNGSSTKPTNDRAQWSKYFKQGNTSITIGNKTIKLNGTTGPTNLLLPSYLPENTGEGVFVTIPKNQYIVKVTAQGRIKFNGAYLNQTIGNMFSSATITSTHGANNEDEYVWITTVKFADAAKPSSNLYIITGSVISNHGSTTDGIGVYIFNKSQTGFKFTCPTLKVKGSSGNDFMITNNGAIVEFTILEYVLIC